MKLKRQSPSNSLQRRAGTRPIAAELQIRSAARKQLRILSVLFRLQPTWVAASPLRS